MSVEENTYLLDEYFIKDSFLQLQLIYEMDNLNRSKFFKR